ncbi:hypothetical protein Bca4012_054937 [Brassica carinata]
MFTDPKEIVSYEMVSGKKKRYIQLQKMTMSWKEVDRMHIRMKCLGNKGCLILLSLGSRHGEKALHSITTPSDNLEFYYQGMDQGPPFLSVPFLREKDFGSFAEQLFTLSLQLSA